MSLRTRITFWLETLQQSASTVFGQGKTSLNRFDLVQGDYEELLDGNTSGKANRQFIGEYSLLAGASIIVDIDLQNFADPNGNTAQLMTRATQVLVYCVPNSDGSRAECEFGGAAVNPWIGWIGPASAATVTKRIKKVWFEDAPEAGFPVTTTSRNVKLKNVGSVTGVIAVYIVGSAP